MAYFSRIWITLFTAILFIGLFATHAYADIKLEYHYKFIGLKNCKMCHSKDKLGNQYGIWSKTKHAQAYKVLASSQALKYAAALGVKDPQKSDRCLVCHTTGFKAPKKIRKKINDSDGITCERCHGAGSLYAQKMKQIAKERLSNPKGDSKTAETTRLIKPTKETCLQCHVREVVIDGTTYINPAYKEFNFDESIKKVSHRRK
ncbi:MAG: cytochrome c family protein [Deltaproteobacteria bacterium]|nr:cytochrome c family protein [Deltaproteobacteria bacterium]